MTHRKTTISSQNYHDKTTARDAQICPVFERNTRSHVALTFYYYKDNTDLNTFSKKRVFIQQKLYGRYPTKKIKVEQLTIQNLVKLIDNKEVHFLNIDIEGLENEILKPLLKRKILPWCIAIEELGETCENINKSKIKKFLNKNGYFLASRTFFTSIYIRKNILKKLPSKYVKEIY